MGFQWVFHIYVNVYPGGVTHGTWLPNMWFQKEKGDL
jgi:hypothetical protein